MTVTKIYINVTIGRLSLNPPRKKSVYINIYSNADTHEKKTYPSEYSVVPHTGLFLIINISAMSIPCVLHAYIKRLRLFIQPVPTFSTFDRGRAGHDDV